MKSRSRKVVGMISGFFLFLLVGGVIFFIGRERNRILNSEIASIVFSGRRIEQTKLLFLGDIMLDRSVKKKVFSEWGGDYARLFDLVAPEIRSADISFANLEGPVSDKGTDRHNLYSFRMDPAVIPVLVDTGFDSLSIANNHVGDWGPLAFEDELHRFASTSVALVGGGATRAVAEFPQIIVRNGTRFGFIGFTDVGPDWLEVGSATPGILLASDPRFSTIISAAAKECDVLIVSFHWGVEYKDHSNTRQEELAHKAVDAGARLVIGAHPHVSQETEFYNGGFIAYSLGNFIFDQYFSEATMRGMGLLVIMRGKTIEGIEAETYLLNAKNQPELVASQSLFKKEE